MPPMHLRRRTWEVWTGKKKNTASFCCRFSCLCGPNILESRPDYSSQCIQVHAPLRSYVGQLSKIACFSFVFEYGLSLTFTLFFSDYESHDARALVLPLHYADTGTVPLPTLYDTGGGGGLAARYGGIARYGPGGPGAGGGGSPYHRIGAGGAFVPSSPGQPAVLSPQQHEALQNRLYGGPSRGLGPLPHRGGGGGGFATVGGVRLGAVEFLLYNIGAMLAGVAAGYDVRESNVTPVHPRLLPKR